MSTPNDSPNAGLPQARPATFLLRCRGRQEGPHSAEVLERKLAANEIGMLHEIQHNGEWITMRDYLTERDAISRAARQAREEAERNAREEVERRAREREELRREQSLAQQRGHSPPSENAEILPLHADLLRTIQSSLLKLVCVISLLAFFLPNVSITIPVLGSMDVSMLDFFTPKSDDGKSSPDKPKKPSVVDVTALRVEKATVGGMLAAASVLALILHYVLTVVCGTLIFGYRKIASKLNTVWLCLGLQFPILFSIAVSVDTCQCEDGSCKSGRKQRRWRPRDTIGVGLRE